MRLVRTRANSPTNQDSPINRSLLAPRKAYRLVGVLISIDENGREMLVQWKGNDDMWQHGTFVVPNDAVVAKENRGPAQENAAQLNDMEPGDAVTIDYLPLGPQNLALVIRCHADESASGLDREVDTHSQYTGMCSSMPNEALYLSVTKKACA